MGVNNITDDYTGDLVGNEIEINSQRNLSLQLIDLNDQVLTRLTQN